MDPPSPSKLGTAPPWSAEAVYGELLPQSPSLPVLSAIPPRSPTRSPRHQRTGSDVSVNSMRAMFENLGVKDSREVAEHYKDLLEKERKKWSEKFDKLDRDHAMHSERRTLRIEELESQLAQAQTSLQVGVSRENYEKEFMSHKANIKKWEQVFKQREDQWKADHLKAKKLEEDKKVAEAKCNAYKAKAKQLTTENLRVTNMVPTMQAKVQGLEREVRRVKSDLDHKTREADNHKNQVYGLQVELEDTTARLEEEIQTLHDKLRSTEGERDALKTSLKEEEVLRIAAEGHIPLPAAGADENDDEFGSPIRSPRKQRNVQREDDDKENVTPKKGAVDLKLIQQELATERRLRERAQDQIDFMKMECQFECCSCRIAEYKGKTYVHDDAYVTEMQRIKASVPGLTPPASAHEDDPMDDVVIKQEPVDARPFTPPFEEVPAATQEEESSHVTTDNTVFIHPQFDETIVAFSPSTGTFRAIASPVKLQASAHIATPAKPSTLSSSAVMETSTESSPLTPEAHSMLVPAEVQSAATVNRRIVQKENKNQVISIHEDAIEDDEEEDDWEPPTPRQEQEPFEPATPAHYELRTTTTTIPIAFSPATPAFRPGRGPMTPSTVAHAASNAQTPILGELSLNKLPFDREAALEAIRQRRGRARSMAAGQGTPMKQMVEGVKDRRDISAPVSRARR
ncbi:hypothetical protein CC86DRAFT_465880 [Ophiobolus disseminans]|uniref:Uncharacterized protein n=1 Tax=Ophiobolus disseminans TaxID=1469910 RepID=A0A6A7A5S1_9PLEO|nr:hypothetical protein CC86DRAFT_465880 [Ophiobolus disseminans]